MLNELLSIERGLRQHGFRLAEKHPDVKEIGKSDAPLRVRLAADVRIARIEATKEGQLELWTLRDGQHNSFPYLRMGRPLLSTPADRESLRSQSGTPGGGSRARLHNGPNFSGSSMRIPSIRPGQRPGRMHVCGSGLASVSRSFRCSKVGKAERFQRSSSGSSQHKIGQPHSS